MTEKQLRVYLKETRKIFEENPSENAALALGFLESAVEYYLDQGGDKNESEYQSFEK